MIKKTNPDHEINLQSLNLHNLIVRACSELREALAKVSSWPKDQIGPSTLHRNLHWTLIFFFVPKSIKLTIIITYAFVAIASYFIDLIIA